MIGKIRRRVRRALRSAKQRVKDSLLLDPVEQRALAQIAGLSQTNQLLLALKYQELARAKSASPPLHDIQFRCYSQNGEDGILWYIFAVIGATNKRCVEICAGAGIECNTANLIANHGWLGLLFDGDQDNVELGKRFYSANQDTFSYAPRFVHAWITRDNINSLIAKEGFRGSVDLLSVDMDGVDYWIWKAIDVIQPRVVVLEYQDSAGPERAITVPYADDFNAPAWSRLGSEASGCSLMALVKLGREKGYRLVGTERLGFNAFFVLNGIGEDMLPEVSPASCFSHPKVLEDIERRWPLISHLPWVEV